MRYATTALVLTLSLAGCATLTPVRPTSSSPEGVQVVLKKRDLDLFKLDVYNSSAAPIVVNRDAIVLQHPGAIEQRRPGGMESTYVILPGGHHAVNVKFSLAGLSHGDPVWIRFDNALYANDVPLDVEPLELRVD